MSLTRRYLDHAATTPILPSVVSAMTEVMAGTGNPSSLHAEGRTARRRVEESREAVAEVLGARPSEVIFTSGGTESNNIALQGMWRARGGADRRRRRIIVSAIEHSAVLDCVDALAAEGAEVVRVPVGRDGRLSLPAVQAAIEGAIQRGERGPDGADTVAYVSVMWVNNEVGTVQPVAEIVELAHGYGIPVHTDAVQAVGHLSVNFGASGADLASVSGHKIGGPAGVGVMLARGDAPVQPMSFGGGQERGVRSGTVATALVVGLAEALRCAEERMPEQSSRLTRLRDRLLTGAVATVPGVTPSGAWEPGDTRRRSPANAHLLVPDCESDSLLFLLDAAGIACSTGSACHAGVPEPSHVIVAMGYSRQSARGALRLSFGHTSTEEDVTAFLAVLPEAVERAQRAYRASLARRIV
ncbi:MAG TPA: cysteine desulfurase family protein [Dermatophilaceae bacterium]|nr:cysteine desulfurase family protein [Dermatophilaceae bacterium]